MKKLILSIIFISIILLVVWNHSTITGSVANNKTETVERDLEITTGEPEPDKQQLIDIDNTDEKTIYLTFDDGPSSATNDILDTLKHYHAKATFFMLEPHMKQFPDIVKRIVEEGHSVGLHGVTHNKKLFYKSEQSALDEMNKGQEALEKLTGIKSTLIRTPYGSVPYLLESYRKELDNEGFKLWDWNVDSSDWSLGSKAYINVTIKQIEKLHKGNVTPIVLMHDKNETAKHLSTLLEHLTKNGFLFKKIEEYNKPYSFNCYDRCYRMEDK
ncbi:polysaccharide deacetylase family protein [Cohnella abietis]|uniref:Putative polysaccharide deacetylase YheN n=1 Tax=Cohnella abietis TaxID=2507935 RepID=A0A3T1D7L5_9BACL|nr:polysaccharide deacetylase family protein [Cohnella abietis]BBI34063.1 putative polysaccharide deacetylase YheN [Cohnella abietis]